MTLRCYALPLQKREPNHLHHRSRAAAAAAAAAVASAAGANPLKTVMIGLEVEGLCRQSLRYAGEERDSSEKQGCMEQKARQGLRKEAATGASSLFDDPLSGPSLLFLTQEEEDDEEEEEEKQQQQEEEEVVLEEEEAE